MPRFDVHRQSGGTLLLDVQTDLISGLNTRLVIPLLPAEHSPPPTRRLHPIVTFEGRHYIIATQLMAGIPKHELGPAVGDLWNSYDLIVAAIDMIFVGF